MLHDEARPVFDRFDDPLMRELVKDICIERQLRQDVFVRGARRLSTTIKFRASGRCSGGGLAPYPAVQFDHRSDGECSFLVVSRSDRIEAPSPISARGALVMPSSWARWNFHLSPLQQRPREPAGGSSVRRARLRNERFALKAAQPI